MAEVGTRLVFENERIRVWEFTHEILVELKP